ncbi:hypothetical protein N0V83_005561 [Neocucurbitaria cava]|uniref:Uncharacterized protein n=1 Tax=Neocucurbitaria cava TaxID=798079 RepID=A0A9W8Y836_9PLEO|nr:hypothetical protein N0V83_005561 [Neocucurbitaria cava]
MNQKDQEMRPTVLKRENLALRDKLAAYVEIINYLARLPPATAQHVQQRLRSGSDPTDVLQSLKGQSFEMMPSAQDMARSILPPIHSNGELELLVNHPGAFPLVDLSQRAQDTGNTLVTPVTFSTLDNGKLGSSFMPLNHDELSSQEAQSFRLLEDSVGRASSSIAVDTTTPQYFDPRLASLNIDFWTSVPISNAQAAAAISLYFEAQHHTWGVFDCELFLSDLIGLRFDFCSPYPEASRNSYAFEKEAEKLLQSEGTADSLPTIAGLALLYVSLSVHGEGLRALKFLTAASEAAEKLKLFGVPEALETLSSASLETLVATSATAWGLFNVIV